MSGFQKTDLLHQNVVWMWSSLLFAYTLHVNSHCIVVSLWPSSHQSLNLMVVGAPQMALQQYLSAVTHLWPPISKLHACLFLVHLYISTGRAIAVTTTSVSALASWSALLKMLKFLVKVFKSLYVLHLWMNLVDTLPDVRYWSEVLCCTITTHIGHLEVKSRTLKF